MKAEISNRDLRRLETLLRRDATRRRKVVSDIVKGALITAESKAGVSAPVDTGRLRQSIRFQMLTPLEGVVYTNVHYAKYQNDGTSRIKGKRFMEKGYVAGAKYMIRKIRAAI